MNKILIEILVVLIVILLLFLGLLHPIWMVGVILLFFLGFHLYIYGGIFWGGMRLRKLLSKNGRVITLKEAKKKVSQSEGTIIVEAPTLGCNVNRLWWSPDVDIKNNKEFLGDQQDYIHEACENYDKYISEETGSAKLFDVFVITQRTKKYLTKHFGHCDFCFIPSGQVWLQRQVDKGESNADSGKN